MIDKSGSPIATDPSLRPNEPAPLTATNRRAGGSAKLTVYLCAPWTAAVDRHHATGAEVLVARVAARVRS